MKQFLVFTLLSCFLISSISSKAQQIYSSENSKPQDISPTDLLQIYKVWQTDDPLFYKYTLKYVMEFDNHWSPLLPPQVDNDGVIMMMGYMIKPLDNKTWFKNKEYMLNFTWDKPGNTKAVIYNFLDLTTWKRYLQQMQIMNAVEMGSRPFEGGSSVVYRVNDISFMFIDFPPGINGEDHTYQITIRKINN